MPDGFANKPRILRGAFVEFGPSVPPLVVPFQFNPVQLARNRRLTHKAQGQKAESTSAADGDKVVQAESPSVALREFHRQESDLWLIQNKQIVEVHEQEISFDIRLDATDKLNEGDPIATRLGIAPQLATLELMVLPKDESLAGKAAQKLLSTADFSFTKRKNPPMIIFIWGRKRVLPVNINSMNITETEFDVNLNPIRATVSVALTVIEGANVPYNYSKAAQEAMSALNLANVADVVDIVIPV
jgi:hypothetical protein